MSGEEFYLTLPSDSSRHEYPNNTNNSFKVRLPAPIRLNGLGWKVGLTSISLPDNKLIIPAVTDDPKTILFKYEWLHGENYNHHYVSRLNLTDLNNVFSRMNGVEFMKSVLNFCQQKRYKTGGKGAPVYNPEWGASFISPKDNGRTYVDFAWDGDELLIKSEGITKQHHGVAFKVNATLAKKMGWLSDDEKQLGPNLLMEFIPDKIPAYPANILYWDVFTNYMPEPEKPDTRHMRFWVVKDDVELDGRNDGKFLFLSVHVNWRFVNLNKAYQNVAGTSTRSLFVYSDAAQSSVVGNQVTDLIREVKYDRKGVGMVYFEPLHIQYIPVRKDTLDIIQTLVTETNGPLAILGKGTTIVTLHFKRT